MFKRQVADNLAALALTKKKDVNRDLLKQVAEDSVSTIQALDEQLGNRFFYTYAPIGDKPLIDPAVGEMQITMAAKQAKQKQKTTRGRR